MAAFRDGIIGSALRGITTNDDEAFAVLLTATEELVTRDDGSIRYRPATQRGRTKLLRNIATRNPVRVLRSCDLASPLAPKAGLRYDGL